MKKFPGYMFCACLLMSTSAALSDNHLDRTVKFRNGEKYAGCVYGPSGTNFSYVFNQQRYANDPNRDYNAAVDKVVTECGSAWEGKGLYQAVLETGGAYIGTEEMHHWKDLVVDLQTAYNCCTTDETRLGFCKEQSDWLRRGNYSCADYLETMRGNLPGHIEQPDANAAAAIGCMKALGEDVPDYKEWLTSSKYHARIDKIWEECEKSNMINATISHMFDFLRDETDCLWNNPDKDFCGGSRRGFVNQKGDPYGDWEVTE